MFRSALTDVVALSFVVDPSQLDGTTPAVQIENTRVPVSSYTREAEESFRFVSS